MHVVIFTGGNLENGKAVAKSLQDAELILAADSGAETAVKNHVTPAHVFGDFDSLSQEGRKLLEAKKVIFHEFVQEKDETDTELAINFAKEQGSTQIDILGGVLGNRLDHVLANVFFASSSSVVVRFINGNQITWIEQGPVHVSIQGEKGDLLSLLPLSDIVAQIKTQGLFYPLVEEQLTFGQPRGVSNIFTVDTASVAFTSGKLVFVHTLTQK